MNKIIKQCIFCLFGFLISLSINPIYADSDIIEDTEEVSSKYEYITDKDNHKVTFTMPIEKTEGISGDVYVLYEGEDTDIYMVLSDLNNYSASQIVPEGKYRIYSVSNGTNKKDYSYKSIKEFTVEDNDVEIYVHVEDQNNNSINSNLIDDKSINEETFSFDTTENIPVSGSGNVNIVLLLAIGDILVVIIMIIIIALIVKRKKAFR